MNVKKFLILISLFILSVANSVGFLSESQPAKTVYLFSHGLGGNKHQAGPYKRYDIIDEPLFSFNYPDALHEDTSFATFGQDEDMACIRSAYMNICDALSHNNQIDLIIVGVSRGASAALIFAARQQPGRVKAMVVESPFDTIDTVLENKVKRLKMQKVPFANALSRKVFSAMFPRYDHNGIKPINMVSNISKSIPILIICSKKDKLVPWWSSARIYKKMRESGHEHVYLLILDNGQHGTMIIEEEGELYQQVVHAFYKKYGFAHDSELAEKGRNRFILCQPDPETLGLDQIK